MSLGDSDTFHDLSVNLSDLTDKRRIAQGAEEKTLEGNSHPILPNAFNAAELPSHWSGKQKENPIQADEPEPPAKRNQSELRCT
jgi:hypothetical protein